MTATIQIDLLKYQQHKFPTIMPMRSSANSEMDMMFANFEPKKTKDHLHVSRKEIFKIMNLM